MSRTFAHVFPNFCKACPAITTVWAILVPTLAPCRVTDAVVLTFIHIWKEIDFIMTLCDFATINITKGFQFLTLVFKMCSIYFFAVHSNDQCEICIVGGPNKINRSLMCLPWSVTFSLHTVDFFPAEWDLYPFVNPAQVTGPDFQSKNTC